MPRDPLEMILALVGILRGLITAHMIRNVALLGATVFLLLAVLVRLLSPEGAFELASGGLGLYLVAFGAHIFVSRTAALTRWLNARPEALLFKDDAQRSNAVGEIALNVAGTGRFVVAAIIAMLSAFVLGLALKLFGVSWLGPMLRFFPWAPIMIWLLPLVLPLIVLLGYPLLWRQRAQRQLRQRLV